MALLKPESAKYLMVFFTVRRSTYTQFRVQGKVDFSQLVPFLSIPTLNFPYLSVTFPYFLKVNPLSHGQVLFCIRKGAYFN